MANKPGSRLRGYGYHHQQVRKQWAKVVAAGDALCARCGRWIKPGTPWDLDHDDSDPRRKKYLGPSHAKCNRGAPHRRQPARRSRIW
jgi:hypothetical protein